MAEQHVDKEIPFRDEAPSPADDSGKDGPNFRLLIVANRLPITINKQADVTLATLGWLTFRGVTSTKSPREDWRLL